MWGIQVVEALANREGLTAALSIGFPQILIESESLSLINLMNQEQPILSEIGGVLNDIMNLDYSSAAEFIFIGKFANLVGHNLTCLALNCSILENRGSLFFKIIF